MPEIGAVVLALDDTPVDGETAKGITSNWAYDHKADPVAHHPAINAGEGHITILPLSYSEIIQGSLSWTHDATEYPGTYVYNLSNAQNDQVDYKVYLEAGTYTFFLFSRTNTVQAILTLLIDGVSKGTIDQYSASLTPSHRQTIENIVVATKGLKTISLKAATRNANATEWYIVLGYFVFFRTA